MDVDHLFWNILVSGLLYTLKKVRALKEPLFVRIKTINTRNTILKTHLLILPLISLRRSLNIEKLSSSERQLQGFQNFIFT